MTGGSQIIRVGLQILSTVFLARLLSPDDFGVVAMVMPVLALASLFQDFGFQQAVIQAEHLDQNQLSRIFWLGVGLCAVVATALIASSPLVGAFYKDGRATPLTAAWAAPILIGSFGSLQSALLARGMRYGLLSAIDAAVAVVSFVSVLAAAYYLKSYWALWLSSTMAALMQAGALWVCAKWRPAAPWIKADTSSATRFGMNMTGAAFLTFCARNLDNVIIARAFGATSLGFYDRAYKLMMFPLQNINAPVARVLTPILSRMQSDPPRLRAAYIKAASQVALLCVPGIAAAGAAAPEVVHVLLGPHWSQSAPIFAWLAVAGVVQPLNNSTGWLFICQGRSREMLHWSLYSGLTAVAAFAIGAFWGPVGVAAAYAISEWVLRTPPLYFVMQKIGPVNVKDFVSIQLPLVVSAGLIWLLAYLLRPVLGHAPIILLAIATTASYAVSLGLLTLNEHGRMLIKTNLSLLSAGYRRIRGAGPSGVTP